MPQSKVYDYVFLTHLPSFYKVNLYQEIAKSCRIFVIFISSSSQIRPMNFTQRTFSFDHCILNGIDFEKCSVVSSLLKLQRQLGKIQYKKLVVGGWDRLEFWWAILFSPKRKNALALESSIFESHVAGIKGKIKQIFLRKISTAFCSGRPQALLLKMMKFTGEIKYTLGVGIFNYPVNNLLMKNQDFQSKFLYVGRLSPEKNIETLIKAFKALPYCTLTLIGDGPLKEDLKKIASQNITFIDYVKNEELNSFYKAHDVFILPSLKEPWGLVVEEALFNGLPVIVSKNVGCAYDLVQHDYTGLRYHPAQVNDLINAITKMSERYSQFKKNVLALDFRARDQFQIQQYVDALV